MTFFVTQTKVGKPNSILCAAFKCPHFK